MRIVYILSTIILVGAIIAVWQSEPMNRILSEYSASIPSHVGHSHEQTKSNQKEPKENGEVKYSLKDIAQLTNEGNYCSPKWSPDGEKLLFTTVSFKGLYYMSLSDKVIHELNSWPGSGYCSNWRDDESVYYRRKSTNDRSVSVFEVQTVSVRDGEITPRPEMHPDGLESYRYHPNENRIVVYTNTNTLQIEGKYTGKDETWSITQNNEGQFYHALPSPDQTKVVVHEQGIMYLYDINGNGLIDTIGRGIASDWSNDGKSVLFFVTTDDGHFTTGSDIYIYSIESHLTSQLTDSPDVFEMFPVFSPDNRQISYSEDKTGAIYVGRITENR